MPHRKEPVTLPVQTARNLPWSDGGRWIWRTLFLSRRTLRCARRCAHPWKQKAIPTDVADGVAALKILSERFWPQVVLVGLIGSITEQELRRTLRPVLVVCPVSLAQL
jgi:hypothetical protein